MNEVTALLKKHTSIRKFTGQPVTDEQLHAIVESAQCASTSSNVQAYSIIRVADEHMKQQLSVLSGNYSYVLECPVFLVWCADLFRLHQAHALHEDAEPAYIGTTEHLIVATVDTALAAQNAAIAAESMGLGIVYIGGIRNHIAEVAKLLQLPKYVYPVFGMCLGYPDQQPGLRPRLPLAAVLHENTYDPERMTRPMEEYDRIIQQYITKRTGGKKTSTWSEDMTAKLKTPARLHMKSFLELQGFGTE
ncbi:oxygen-insensitive NADPH nitroreductase [Paenibacillus piri]|uniref:Oxygen-insensitive NADPH nitroreductase n=1 Tax=Paenibacillus piri TaxID=2547395 RepID=A0A4R5KFB1_9BACL|nr:oxygen-insensitive NADPH nitroreductase [Paenibacillus piri]TDF94109.1 oxygen-insensitive NADPH nitroreductase [Paenibacillus piri]